jgi:hypothetical protein
MKQPRLSKKKKYEIYEHLEHYVRKTTYTHRLQWLQEANDWVNLLKKQKIIPADA